jgi:hypothetical protein
MLCGEIFAVCYKELKTSITLEKGVFIWSSMSLLRAMLTPPKQKLSVSLLFHRL